MFVVLFIIAEIIEIHYLWLSAWLRRAWHRDKFSLWACVDGAARIIL